MSDIILHHYPESPFAEKVRLILGFKRLSYRSVLVPMMLPKPDVIALTGGYRRAPMMQIGSDVYCDTALIADVLERIQPTPSLYPQAHAASPLASSQRGRISIGSRAGVGFAMQPEGFNSMFERYSPEHRAAFIEDRKAFRRGAPRMALHVATALLSRHLGNVEQQFSDGRPFLLGSDATIADFSFFDPLLVHRARDRGSRLPVRLPLYDAMDATHCGNRPGDSDAAQQRRSNRNCTSGRNGAS